MRRQRRPYSAWSDDFITHWLDVIPDHFYEHDDEPVICSHFGCRQKLSLREQLCGSKCNKHSVVNEIDGITLMINT